MESKSRRSIMRPADVRNWLGSYVLGLTSVLGAWLFMAPKGLLPLEDPDRTATAQIVIPFLMGQLAAVFQYFSSQPRAKSGRIDIPSWVVKAPPIVITIILLVQFTMLGVGAVTDHPSLISTPEAVRSVITFCVAILNASTVYVMAAYFETKKAQDAGAVQKDPNVG